MRILCYQYECDYHCIDCTANRYENNGFKDYEDNKLIAQYKVDRISGSLLEDSRGDEAYDKEGNPVYVVYYGDEWYELDESYLSENPIQYMSCGTCREVVATYEHEPQEPDTFGFSRAINWEVVNNLSNDELEKLFN